MHFILWIEVIDQFRDDFPDIQIQMSATGSLFHLYEMN